MLTPEAKAYIEQCYVQSKRRHELVVDGATLNIRQLSRVLVEKFPELKRFWLGTIDQDINTFVNTLGHRIEKGTHAVATPQG